LTVLHSLPVSPVSGHSQGQSACLKGAMRSSTGHVDGEDLGTEAAFSQGVNLYADGHRISVTVP
jgi:hypothetical protein